MSEQSVAVLETALTRLIRRALLPTTGDRTLAAAGVRLERASYAVLVRVSEHAPMRMSALAEVMGLDVSTVSRQVAKLEQDGYVQRSPDPEDGRASLLGPTNAGCEILGRVRDARRAHLQGLLTDWDDSDVDRLADLLTRFLDTSDLDRDR